MLCTHPLAPAPVLSPVIPLAIKLSHSASRHRLAVRIAARHLGPQPDSSGRSRVERFNVSSPETLPTFPDLVKQPVECHRVIAMGVVDQLV